MQKYNKQSSKKLMSTNDYSMFKHLVGQRVLNPKTIARIVDSIKEVGYITSPIIVNEKYEIIDGQHRLEAFRQLEIPVEYIVHEGANIFNCIKMNIIPAKWQVEDYVHCYCEIGNDNYIKFRELAKKYSDLTYDTVARACGCSTGRSLCDGSFIFPNDNYGDIDLLLEWLSTFSLLYATGVVKGRTEVFYASLIFCYYCDKIDNERLENKLLEYDRPFPGYNSIYDCLKAISSIYNYKIARSNNKVYLETEYQQELDAIHTRNIMKANQNKKKLCC